jgi:endonuclease/exonuclease/phosphatase family metal-dependent hydrolase
MMTGFDSQQPDMKIYSWNVLYSNKDMEGVRTFISGLDYDVLCLQEVPDTLLADLKKLPVNIAYHQEVARVLKTGGRAPNYSVILSKHSIGEQGKISFEELRVPLRTRLFVSLLLTIDLFCFVAERGALYADITVNGRILRVFCVHLTLWGPHNRAREFQVLEQHLSPTMPHVIAGDFNIIEFGPLKILSWLLGAPLWQGMPWYPERSLFEKRFTSAGLQNPLRNQVTHPFSKSQLDHILLSNDFTVTEATVLMDAHGSDHHPVTVTAML